MLTRLLTVLSILLILTTVLFIVLLAQGTAATPQGVDFGQVLANLARPNAAYTLAYLNAALITLLATAWMACLYRYCRDAAPEWATIGVIFVPVYAAFNLFAYLSQITLVPALVKLWAEPQYQAAAEVLLHQVIQMMPNSAVGFFNGLAYALLGIPSIIFGVILFRMRSSKAMRAGAALLALNGVACILGVPGVMLDSPLFASGSLVGAVFFLLSLFPLGWAFHSK